MAFEDIHSQVLEEFSAAQGMIEDELHAAECRMLADRRDVSDLLEWKSRNRRRVKQAQREWMRDNRERISKRRVAVLDDMRTKRSVKYLRHLESGRKRLAQCMAKKMAVAMRDQLTMGW